MRPRSPKHLYDIREAATFILEQTRGLTADAYAANRLVKAAVERNFIIIGEAMNQLSRDDSQTAAVIGKHPQIIAFRNVLVHAYDDINDQKVWRVITEDLAALVEQTDALLERKD